MDKLLAELDDLIDQWDQEAKDRHLEGMSASAETLRACRDELRRLRGRYRLETALPPRSPKPPKQRGVSATRTSDGVVQSVAVEDEHGNQTTLTPAEYEDRGLQPPLHKLPNPDGSEPDNHPRTGKGPRR